MISYEPLAKTLASRNMGITELGNKIGNRSLRAMINSGDRLSLITLDKICLVLGCEVQDVIMWRPGPQCKNSWIKSYAVNWDEVKRRADEKGWSFYFISKQMGKYPGFLAVAKRCKTTKRLTVRTLASYLGCEVKDIATEVVITPGKDK